MNQILNYIYRNSTIIYKVIIFGVALFLMVFLFSQNSRFQYEYAPNKIWTYNDLQAPFDFTVKKTKKEIAGEKDSIAKHTPLFYEIKKPDFSLLFNDLDDEISMSDFTRDDRNKIKQVLRKLIPEIYEKGFLNKVPENYHLSYINLIDGKIIKKVPLRTLITREKLHKIIDKAFENRQDLAVFVNKLLDKKLPKALYKNDFYYKDYLNRQFQDISINKALVHKGQFIIKKGEVVTQEKYDQLNSLQSALRLYPEDTYHQYWVYAGYGILVSLVLFMLWMFLQKYRPEIFENNVKISLIVLNMLLVVLLTVFTIRHFPGYIFVVPLVVLPLILKAFFDARVALFVHILTVLLLGFVVTNGFEFIYLQIMAGIVSILTVSELTKRSNLFTSVGSIVLVYIIGYFAFHLIYEGSFNSIEYAIPLYFLLNGILAIAFSHQLILLYEKVFGLVSDVSLLEWSNTNSKLLKRLADKAPGTFNHSMQVANLAEAAANAIHANSLLVRAGALYHDIGKMLNPFYFTENQTSGVNYHDDLPPEESARIIINHVLDGVELARKNKVPDRLIDFIRTHHGRGLVQYFYKKALETNPDIDPEKFRYPGPNPFSKETAILMMADSVEAASKSLREPTAEKIEAFVDKIIDHQLHSGLLDNANITLKEISTIKKLFKKKLKNIYHLRIEYPE